MASSLDTYLDQHKEAFDVTSIFSRDLAEMESDFTGDVIYKYYSASRRSFFSKPQVRFSQKTALNDPFELTNRWHDFGTLPTRELFVAYLRSSMRGVFSRSRDHGLEFVAHAVFAWWAETKEPEAEQAVLKLMTSNDDGAVATLFSLAHASEVTLRDAWPRLLFLSLLWAGLSILAPRYGKSPEEATRWSRWLKWLCGRNIAGASAPASFEPVAIAERVERVADGSETTRAGAFARGRLRRKGVLRDLIGVSLKARLHGFCARMRILPMQGPTSWPSGAR